MAAGAYADSLLGSFKILASNDSGHLIDASGLANFEMPLWSAKLEAAFKVPYSFDAANSKIEQSATSENEATFTSLAHFSISKVPAGSSPPVLSDTRSAATRIASSFSLMPEQPMEPRASNNAIGYFEAERRDLSYRERSDSKPSWIARWRLDLEDPKALRGKVSNPVTFEICPEMPEKYRAATKEAVAAWIPAFEKIGLSGALATKQLLAGENSASGRKASICFVAGEDNNVALGPSKIDPRSGEIMEARIQIPEPFTAGARFEYDMAMAAYTGTPPEQDESEGREAYALAQFKHTLIHEIGHALGLRHNFHGSAANSSKDLSSNSPHGPLSASVMDYLPANLWMGRRPSAEAFQQEIGAYDIWAIGYGYAKHAPASEKAELAKWAAMSETNPELALGSDEELHAKPLDPHTNAFDLGADPLAFANNRLDWAEAALKAIADGTKAGSIAGSQAKAYINHALNIADRQYARLPYFLSGMEVWRSPGPSKRPSLSPIPLSEQRAALEMFTHRQLGRYLAIPSVLEIYAVDVAKSRAASGASLDWENTIEAKQQAALKNWFTPETTDRAMEVERLFNKSGKPRLALGLAEIHEAIFHSVWKEPLCLANQREANKGKATKESCRIDASRMSRNVQRAYVDAIATALRAPANLSTDPRALFDSYAKKLFKTLTEALRASNIDEMERLHYEDALRSLSTAMDAKAAQEKP